MSEAAIEQYEQGEILFFGLERIDRTKPVYHATAKIFRRTRPAEYRLAVELLGRDKHSIRELEELLHVSHHTLEAVRQEESEKLATLRQKCARQNLALHEMCLDRAQDLIPRCDDLQKLAVSSGIFAEKSNLLAGEATARIEEVKAVNLVERFQIFVTSLEKKAAAREIGDEAGNKLTNSATPALLDQAAPAEAEILARVDSESEVLNRSTEGSKPIPYNQPNKSDRARGPRAAAAAGEGGGGGRPRDGGPGSPNA